MSQACEACSGQHRAEAFILAILVLNTNQLTWMLECGVCFHEDGQSEDP